MIGRAASAATPTDDDPFGPLPAPTPVHEIPTAGLIRFLLAASEGRPAPLRDRVRYGWAPTIDEARREVRRREAAP